jgi:hypothetical protein
MKRLLNSETYKTATYDFEDYDYWQRYYWITHRKTSLMILVEVPGSNPILKQMLLVADIRF